MSFFLLVYLSLHKSLTQRLLSGLIDTRAFDETVFDAAEPVAHLSARRPVVQSYRQATSRVEIHDRARQFNRTSVPSPAPSSP
jgi:hypothetical protein